MTWDQLEFRARARHIFIKKPEELEVELAHLNVLPLRIVAHTPNLVGLADLQSELR